VGITPPPAKMYSAPSSLSHWHDEWGRQDKGTNPVLGIQCSTLVTCCRSSNVLGFLVIFERVNFIRPAGEMDSTSVALGNPPDKVSPVIPQNDDWVTSSDILGLFTRSGVHSALRVHF